MNLIPLIQVFNLKKYFIIETGFLQRIFSVKNEYVHAVDDISFSIHKGEIFCLVGESGCGKSTTANILVGLDKPTTGNFSWNGEKITFEQLIPRKKDIKSQIIFQNPYSSLNPRMTLGQNVLHPLIIHNKVKDKETKKVIRRANYSKYFLLTEIILFIPLILLGLIIEEPYSTLTLILNFVFLIISIILFTYFSWYQRGRAADKTVLKLFEEIGLSPPKNFYFKYPHEVSGGERQRISLARAIILEPELLIADEPTSMLDVSCRAGILDLLKFIQTKYDLSILFITHDLATARHFGDTIGVMYVGKIVEKGEVENLFEFPLHPYTKALINAIPDPNPEKRDFELPKGEVADAINPPSGCRFHPRCPNVDLNICSIKEPELIEVRPNHWVACHFPSSKTKKFGYNSNENVSLKR